MGPDPPRGWGSLGGLSAPMKNIGSLCNSARKKMAEMNKGVI